MPKLQSESGNCYDHPQYYDIVFGADWRDEVRFLEGCFTRYARRPVRRLFEPACGTGRLLARFAAAGYEIGGNDLSPAAVAYCNRRLARLGCEDRTEVGDMSAFRLARPVDAAFNTINTFRHLPDDRRALAHLRCMADALAPGGIYVLGLHLTPDDPPACVSETWSARRGSAAVEITVRTESLDRLARAEHIELTMNVRTPRRRFRLVDRFIFRTYSYRQLKRLIAKTPLEIVAAYDFGYEIDQPIDIEAEDEDVVLVLRKPGGSKTKKSAGTRRTRRGR